LEKNSFELTIIEYNEDPNGGYKFTSNIQIKQIIYIHHTELPNFKIFRKTNNCDFFLNNVLFNSYIKDDDKLIKILFLNFGQK
jgi:spore cortex formation protein SpoVR/YcgB (stage V sporulation)